MTQQIKTLEVGKLELANLVEFSDAHCHLNLFKDVDGTIKGARKMGVSTIVTSGGSGKDNADSVRLAEREHVFAVVGIGPDFSASDSAFVKEIGKLVKSSIKVVGIGEIGIDVGVVDKNRLEIQKRVFEEQLQIAKELEMPVVIHSRGALDEILKILEKEHIKRAMFHFFEGDEKQAALLAKEDYLISIPPAETEKRRRVVRSTGLRSIVAETDSPIVGKTPADVVGVCELIAELKGISLEEVAAGTTENIRRLFYI